jgi:hypothetical protein
MEELTRGARLDNSSYTTRRDTTGESVQARFGAVVRQDASTPTKQRAQRGFEASL